MNRYNDELQVVRPVATNAYAITPAQAQQLDRMTQPDTASHGTPSQSSVTNIDIGKFLEPIKITEQFSPVEQAAGIVRLALIGLGLSAVVTVCLGIALQPSFEVAAIIYFAATTIITLALYWRQTAYSQIGLGFKRLGYQRDVVMKLIDSNETVSMAKLANDDAAQARRSKAADRYLDILEGKRHGQS